MGVAVAAPRGGPHVEVLEPASVRAGLTCFHGLLELVLKSQTSNSAMVWQNPRMCMAACAVLRSVT